MFILTGRFPRFSYMLVPAFYHKLKLFHLRKLTRTRIIEKNVLNITNLTIFRLRYPTYNYETMVRRFETICKILWPLTLAPSDLKVVKCVIFTALIFWIIRVRDFWKMFYFQFLIENRGQTVCHYTRNLTISRSREISWPKCVILVQRDRRI